MNILILLLCCIILYVLLHIYYKCFKNTIEQFQSYKSHLVQLKKEVSNPFIINVEPNDY